MKALIVLLFLALAACSKSPPSSDQPGNRHFIRGETNLARLLDTVAEGRADPMPWSGNWYAYSGDGIAESATLYESAFGQNGAVDWERSHHGSSLPGIQEWFGHCNGWAAAAALFPEPREATVSHGVTFEASDQKALLSEVAMEVNADFFGARNDDNNPSSLSFQDIFPDQFFLVLTNILGHGQPLIMDRYTGNQVWNQALAGYRISPVSPSDYLGADSVDGAPSVYRVQLSTELWWLRDDVSPDHLTEPFSFADGPSYDSRVLRFELWLDGPVVFGPEGGIVSSGNILLARRENTVIGGDWNEGETDVYNSHPDYMWVPHAVAASSGLSNPKIAMAHVLEVNHGLAR